MSESVSQREKIRRLEQSNKDLRRITAYYRDKGKIIQELKIENRKLESRNHDCNELLRKNNQKYEREINELKENLKFTQEKYVNERRELIDSCDGLRHVINSMNACNRLMNNTTSEKVNKWKKTSLRLDWLICEMEKVGAIRLPEHEWATDMREDIEYPNNDGVSIYKDISREIKRECLPNYEDAHIEMVSSEEETRRYSEWSEEASVYVASLESVETLGIHYMFDEEETALQGRREMGQMTWTDDVEDYEISDMFDEDEDEDEIIDSSSSGVFEHRRVWRFHPNTGEEQEFMCNCGGVGPCMQCGFWQMVLG